MTPVKKNLITGMILKVSNFPIQFITRLIIVNYFGLQFLGLHSLAISLLNVVMVAEAGIGIALQREYYEAFHCNDRVAKNKIIGIYRALYKMIALISIVVVLLLTFMTIGEGLSILSAPGYWIVPCLYLIGFIFNLIVYPEVNIIINALNKRFILNAVFLVVNMFAFLVQIYTVIVLNTFLGFVLVFSISSVAKRAILIIFFNDILQEYRRVNITLCHLFKECFERTRKIFFHKLSDTLIITLDFLMISFFLGLAGSGQYSPYNYLLVACFSVVDTIMLAYSGTIASKVYNDKSENSRLYYFDVIKVQSAIALFMGISLSFAAEDVVDIWFDGSITAPSFITGYLLGISLFLCKARMGLILIQDTMGLWSRYSYKPVIAITANIALNLLLIPVFGIDGAIIATICVMLIINLPWEIYIVCKSAFGEEFASYLNKLLKFFLRTVSFASLTIFILLLIQGESLYLNVLMSFCIPSVAIMATLKCNEE